MGILYANEVWAKGIYHTFLEVATSLDITILNDEDLRQLPATFSQSDITQYETIYQNLIDTNVRIILLIQLGSFPYYSIEYLYDLGLR